MSGIRTLLGFPGFYFTARTWKAIHSPYLFKFFQFVFDRDRMYSRFTDIQRVRMRLEMDTTPIAYHDYGANSAEDTRQNRSIREIAERSVSSLGQCILRFRIAVFLEANAILEIGTSLGISTAYLATTKKDLHLDTIDASEKLVAYARGVAKNLGLRNINFHVGQFEEVLPELVASDQKYDFVVLDGNHRKDATLQYFETILPALNENAVVLVDDIRWSRGMRQAWEAMATHERVGAAVDLYRYGLLFFRNDFKEKLHLKVLSSRLRPWEYF